MAEDVMKKETPVQETSEQAPDATAQEIDPMQMLRGGQSPLVRKFKSQMLGLERQRARIDDKDAVLQQGVEELRDVVFEEFRKLLEENGVDINDPESIQQFIQGLAEINPDFVNLLEIVFRSIQEQSGGMDFSGLSGSRNLTEKLAASRSKMKEEDLAIEEQAAGEPEAEEPQPEMEEMSPEDMQLMQGSEENPLRGL